MTFRAVRAYNNQKGKNLRNTHLFPENLPGGVKIYAGIRRKESIPAIRMASRLGRKMEYQFIPGLNVLTLTL